MSLMFHDFLLGWQGGNLIAQTKSDWLWKKQGWYHPWVEIDPLKDFPLVYLLPKGVTKPDNAADLL